MLVNKPFYLTSKYIQMFLSYCYERQKIGQADPLQKSALISKLRKVVDYFLLFQESEQKEMILRIAETTSSYPYELEVAFENIKNGDQTVRQKDLIEMFQKLQLQTKYIELIIAELSLCSEDLQHLNFQGFFQRFYIQEQASNQNLPIEEQGEQSEQSRKNSSRLKKPTKFYTKFHNNQMREQANIFSAGKNAQNRKQIQDEEGIISDDIRI